MRTLGVLVGLLLSAQVFAQQTSTQVSTEASTQASSSVSLSAGGVSTTNVIEADLSKKSPYGFLVISAIEVAADDFRDRNSRAALSTTNSFGMTYKTSPDAKIGIRQYFTYINDVDKGNKFDMASTVLTYSKKFAGFWGSDEVAPVIWYYLPTTEKAIQDRSNGKLRASAFISWTIDPKWSFTYYLDPRQSFLPTSVGADGKEIFSHSTWIHSGSFSYNFSDTFSIYQGVGTSEDFRSSSFTLLDESLDISTGMYITLGKVLLIPDITNSIATRKSAEKPAGRSISSTLFRAEETTYSLSMLANF